MKIVRTEEQIARVEAWAGRNLGDKARYDNPCYEQGVIDTLEWLRNETQYAPDLVEDGIVEGGIE